MPTNPTKTDPNPSRTLAAVPGLGCTYCGYTDRHPYMVVEVSKSGKTATVIPLESTLCETIKPEFVPGGFCAHCTNQRELEYDLAIPANPVKTKIRLTKRGWAMKGTPFLMGVAYKFYDYNF